MGQTLATLLVYLNDVPEGKRLISIPSMQTPHFKSSWVSGSLPLFPYLFIFAFVLLFDSFLFS
jgi:hypothetical protein